MSVQEAAGVAQIGVGTGENGTRGLGLLSSTWTSASVTGGWDLMPQANEDQRSLQGGELRLCRNTLQQGRAGSCGWRCWHIISEGNVTIHPQTLRRGRANKEKGAGARGLSQVRCILDPLHRAFLTKTIKTEVGTLCMWCFNMVLLPF